MAETTDEHLAVMYSSVTTSQLRGRLALLMSLDQEHYDAEKALLRRELERRERG